MEDAILLPQRALHNHIFQVKPRLRRYLSPTCPACLTIDLGKMDRDYAELWWLREHADAYWERALRE